MISYFFIDDVSGESGRVRRAGEGSTVANERTASSRLAQERLHHLWQSQLLLQRQWAAGPEEPDSCLRSQRKGSCLYSHLCALAGVHSPWLRLICSQRRRCVVILFYVALFSNQLLRGHHIVLLNLQDYTICDSWNTYHVIKTVQVNPFVPNLHFELPEGDN